jgi:hypothetical protein
VWIDKVKIVMDVLCFHREREDGYCWRCDQEKEIELERHILESVPLFDRESDLQESDSDKESVD